MASRSRKRVSDDFIDDEPRIKKSKNNAASHTKASAFRNSQGGLTRREDANGDSYWEISKMRRVTISSFRGKTMVNIREYYEKDGEEYPGKKGISLPVDQFSALMTLLPDIETALQEKGVSIPRPNYAAHGAASGGDGEGEEEDSTDELSAPGTTRRNIEATSDEDEEEE